MRPSSPCRWLADGFLSRWSLLALVGATFFLASAGASAAYLAVSEIFPMETRAFAIAFFHAVGTGAGGIIGPLLFGQLSSSGESAVVVGFGIGAAVMALGERRNCCSACAPSEPRSRTLPTHSRCRFRRAPPTQLDEPRALLAPANRRC